MSFHLHQVFSALGPGFIELEIKGNVEQCSVSAEYNSNLEPRDLQALPHADSIKPRKERVVAELEIEVFSYEMSPIIIVGTVTETDTSTFRFNILRGRF